MGITRLIKDYILSLREKSLEKMFTATYEKNKWGGVKGQFYSGLGSDVDKLHEYIQIIREFIISSKIKSMLDVGCGDFRVGSEIIKNLDVQYTGIDVVADLIKYNNQIHSKDKIQFLHVNAVDDVLPKADLCHIRQVLQHLSNKEIASILSKMGSYKYVIITEHIATGPDRKYNLDMIHGSGTRVARNSGVFIEHPPFNLQSEIIYELKWDDYGYPAAIRTSLIKNNQ